MFKKIIILLTILLTCFSINTSAVDRDTPWKSGFGGNGFIQANHYTTSWLARHIGYYMIAGSAPLMDSLRDTAEYHGWTVLVGPYASTQELNMLQTAQATEQYAERLLDTATHWQWIYARGWMINNGISEESLVVHIADDMLGIKQNGDSSLGRVVDQYRRKILTEGLNPSETRFTYQYFNDTATDTFAYPSGYVWLANGFSINTQKAIAYAFVQHFIKDSANATIGPNIGGRPPTAFFSDNQYRNGASPRLSSYYKIDSTRGGATSEMDWVEIANIETNQDSLYKYFDQSTGPIDTMVMHWLDSVCVAGGIPKIMQCVNIDKSNVAMLSATLPFVKGVSIENPIGTTSNPPSWGYFAQYADTMAAHLTKAIFWGIATDALYLTSGGTDTASWAVGHIGDIFKFHVAFFACVQDTNAYVSFMRFNDSLRWYNIGEVDLGLPDGKLTIVDTFGTINYVHDTTTYPDTKETDSSYLFVWERYYDDSNNIVLLMTCSDGRWGRTPITAYTTSIEKTISLGEYFYPISDSGETSAVSVNSVTLSPYEAFIGTKKGIRPSVIIDRTAASANANTEMNIIFGIDDDNTICSLLVYFNDSLVSRNTFSGVCTAVGDMINSDTVIPYTPICSDVGEAHWIVHAFNSVEGARYDTNDITIGVANIVSPTLVTYATGGTDTVDAVSTITYTLSGDLTFIADTLWFSKDGGITYPIVFDYHTSEPGTGDTIMAKIITREDTTQNGKFKLRVWSNDPTCGVVSKTIYSTGIMNYIWVDTTVNYIGGDSGTTYNTSAYQAKQKGTIWLAKDTTPVTTSTIFVDSGWLFASANGAGVDTIFMAIYDDNGTSGYAKTPIARSVDSDLTTPPSDATAETLRFTFPANTILNSNSPYWIGGWVFPDSGATGWYGAHIFWELPKTHPGNYISRAVDYYPNLPDTQFINTSNAAWYGKLFYHTRASYADTVFPVIDSICPASDTFITGISNALTIYMSDTSTNANAEERLASCTLRINNQYGTDTVIYDTTYGSEVRYITKVKDYLWRSQDTGNSYLVATVVDTGGNVKRDSVVYLVKVPLTWLQKLGLKLLSIFGVSIR
jgi:hypothetical protein